jgi:rhodanese-related sulfurtransferase
MKMLPLLALAGMGLAQAAPSPITPAAAWHTRHDHGGRALIVDIRGASEVLREGIPLGSDVNVPYLRNKVGYTDRSLLENSGTPFNSSFLREVDEARAEAGLTFGNTVILVCRNGRLSRMAAELLEEHGYGDVRYVEGGFDGVGPSPGWKKAGLPWTRRIPAAWMRY